MTRLLIVCMFLGLTLGCARTVTDKSALLQIDIEIALRGALSPDDYVAIVFNNSTPPTLPAGSNHTYFPLPGQTIREESPAISVTPYYRDYFNTWSDYILCKVGGPSFYASGSTGFPATTTDNTRIAPKTTFTVSHNFQSSTSTLKLSFFVGEIAGTMAGNTLYINILTTRRENPNTDSGASGYFQDVLLSPIAIQLRAGQEIQRLPGQEGLDNSLPAASDIQAWRVSIF